MVVRKMLTYLFRIEFAVACLTTAMLILGCASILTDRGARDGKLNLSDEEFVESIKEQIDEQVTWQDAIDNFEKVRGKVVKWSGHIADTSDDKIQIGDIVYSWQLRNPKTAHYGNSFIFLLDHPLPRESGIRNMSQTIIVGDAIFAIGRIIAVKNVPILEGYVISKKNDRYFKNPVWVGHK
jgi:hypothetical protein